MTNSDLAEIVNLSASQCSRRRLSLEEEGFIKGYKAQLDASRLGMALMAIVRINLHAHNQSSDTELSRWFELQPEIEAAYSMSGDADYILIIRANDLPVFSNFLHEKLLIQPLISQVRSEFVLRTLKESSPLNLSAPLSTFS